MLTPEILAQIGGLTIVLVGGLIAIGSIKIIVELFWLLIRIERHLNRHYEVTQYDTAKQIKCCSDVKEALQENQVENFKENYELRSAIGELARSAARGEVYKQKREIEEAKKAKMKNKRRKKK